MRPEGVTRHPELFGDLFGGAAVGHRLQDLEFPRRESFDPTLQVAIPVPRRANLATARRVSPDHMSGLRCGLNPSRKMLSASKRCRVTGEL